MSITLSDLIDMKRRSAEGWFYCESVVFVVYVADVFAGIGYINVTQVAICTVCFHSP